MNNPSDKLLQIGGVHKTNVIAENVVCDDVNEDIDIEAVENKLTKARTQLILDKPFLGNLVLRLPMKAAGSWCKTSATDAKFFYYNPSFIDILSNDQTKFVLIHEALHCALTHFARRGNRTKHKWDLACDFAINPLLVTEGFIPPINVPVFHKYKGMIAEEIYPMIDDNIDSVPMDQHLYDDTNDTTAQSEGGMREDSLQQHNSQDSSKKDVKTNNSTNSYSSNNDFAEKPKPLSPDEAQQLSAKWQKNLASSAQLAQQAGKLDGEFAKLIDFFLQPQMSWHSLLAQYMSSLARDDFSYSRPSRRSGEAILPSLRSSQIDITVAIDTSGSISQEEINEFISEINAIKSNIRSSITLVACDNKISNKLIWHYEAWDELKFPATLGGGGGTNFNPVFDYIAQQDNQSSVLIYFTDAKGMFPEFEPNYPVMWLIKGKHTIPWGSRIQLN